MKFSIKNFFSKCDQMWPQFPADLMWPKLQLFIFLSVYAIFYPRRNNLHKIRQDQKILISVFAQFFHSFCQILGCVPIQFWDFLNIYWFPEIIKAFNRLATLVTTFLQKSRILDTKFRFTCGESNLYWNTVNWQYIMIMIVVLMKLYTNLGNENSGFIDTKGMTCMIRTTDNTET